MGYATKYVIMNGLKKPKKAKKSLFTLTIVWELQDLQDRGYFLSSLISDHYAAIFL
jgi:hypothetical protein